MQEVTEGGPLRAVPAGLCHLPGGNLGMLLLIQITLKLYAPMYHFVSCLSFVDACYSSIFAPKMLLNFFVECVIISFSTCIVQHFLFVTLITTKGFLLAVMA